MKIISRIGVKENENSPLKQGDVLGLVNSSQRKDRKKLRGGTRREILISLDLSVREKGR